MKYKKIKVKGITYLEPLCGSNEWYWGSDYCHGDLYEAEELFQSEHTVNGNSLVFVKYPEGDVVEPIPKREGQYFGRPVFDNGAIMILLVDFFENKIKVISYHDETRKLATLFEMDKSEIKDCYNLLLRVSPLYLSRDGNEGIYEILWPEKSAFHIDDNETIFQRKEEILISSCWEENPDYREDTIVRKYPTGEIIERISGTMLEMPDKQNWIISSV